MCRIELRQSNQLNAGCVTFRRGRCGSERESLSARPSPTPTVDVSLHSSTITPSSRIKFQPITPHHTRSALHSGKRRSTPFAHSAPLREQGTNERSLRTNLAPITFHSSGATPPHAHARTQAQRSARTQDMIPAQRNKVDIGVSKTWLGRAWRDVTGGGSVGQRAGCDGARRIHGEATVTRWSSRQVS